MTEFSYFRIKDIFSQPGKGDVDLQQSDINGKGEYFINSGETNYGIKGRTDREAKIFPANTITIDFWGNAYYRDFKYKLATHNHVFSFNDSIIKNKNVGLYLVGALQFLKHKYSYSNMLTWNKLKKESVYLPVISKTNEINFKYMEDRVKALEQDRVKALEQDRVKALDNYLTVTGLNDYKLTDCDRKVLSYEPKFSEFRIEDIFEIHKGKRLTKADQKEGNTLFVGSTALNHGETARIGQKPIFKSNTITVCYNGSVGETFYQDEPYWASDDINVLTLKNFKLNAEIAEYLCAVLKKAGSKYGYTYKWNVSRMKKSAISLPVDDKGNMDFQYMENYIKAIQKLTIKNIVQYKDKVINKTKEVIDYK